MASQLPVSHCPALDDHFPPHLLPSYFRSPLGSPSLFVPYPSALFAFPSFSIRFHRKQRHRLTLRPTNAGSPLPWTSRTTIEIQRRDARCHQLLFLLLSAPRQSLTNLPQSAAREADAEELEKTKGPKSGVRNAFKEIQLKRPYPDNRHGKGVRTSPQQQIYLEHSSTSK